MDFFDIGKWDDGGTPKILTKKLFQKQEGQKVKNMMKKDNQPMKPQQSVNPNTEESKSKKKKKNKKKKPKVNTAAEENKNSGAVKSFGANLRNKYKNTSLIKVSEQSNQGKISKSNSGKKRKGVDDGAGKSLMKKLKLQDNGDTLSGSMKHSMKHDESVAGFSGDDSTSPGHKKKRKRKKQKQAGTTVSPTAAGDPAGDVTEGSPGTSKRKKKRKKKNQGDIGVESADGSPSVSKEDSAAEGKEGDSPSSAKKRKRKKKNKNKNKYQHLIGQKSLTSRSHMLDSDTLTVAADGSDMQDSTADSHTYKTVTDNQNIPNLQTSPREGKNIQGESLDNAMQKKKKRKRKLSKSDHNLDIVGSSQIEEPNQSLAHNKTLQNETNGATIPKKKKKKRQLSSSENDIETMTSEVLRQDKTSQKKARSIPRNSIDNSSQLSPLQDKKRDRSTSKLKVKDGGLPFDISKLKSILDSSKPAPKKEQLAQESEDSESDSSESQLEGEPEDVATSKKPMMPKTLGERMKEQLQGARFRYINQQLYTQSGSEALEMMAEDPESFHVYHQGFQSQVAKWPENPVDRVIAYIKNMSGNPTVADFGCGDAKVDQALPNKVHSFDLVAVNDRVTVCDIAHVPLANNQVDVGVFCLALMGTNLSEFICEANRVIKKNGVLLVAEVISRFEKVGSFVQKMAKMGFTLINKDSSNKMFIWFEFKKTGQPIKDHIPEIHLAPCIYKRR